MAMSAGVAELTSVFSLTVIGQNQGATWQQGQELKVCSPSGAVFKKSRVAVTAAASQRESVSVFHSSPLQDSIDQSLNTFPML